MPLISQNNEGLELRMIINTFEAIDDKSADTLKRIQLLLNSDFFLAGLGSRSKELTVPSRYNVINEFERAYYLTVYQDMWDENDDTEDQYFAGILSEIIPYYGGSKLDQKDALARRRNLEKNFTTEFKLELEQYISKVAKERDLCNSMHEYFSETDKDRVELYSKAVENITFTCIQEFLVSAYFGGIDEWPACKYIFESFQIGAFPCGWVGNFPNNLEQEYNAAERCLQVIHFGTKESN